MLRVLTHAGSGPDDVATTTAGDIWLSDTSGGQIIELHDNGTVITTVADAHAPEGIVALPDGKLLVAQQAPDRIDLFDPATRAFTTWLQLHEPAGATGIDGIGIRGSTVLVPDSASGNLLLVQLSAGDGAGAQHVVASSLGRPVGAAPYAGGVLVVAENEPGLVRVDTGGTHTVGGIRMASLDDVIVRNGLAYVTDLADASLVVVDLSSGMSRALVSGAHSPQGLALLSDGSLLLVDSTTRTLATAPTCA